MVDNQARVEVAHKRRNEAGAALASVIMIMLVASMVLVAMLNQAEGVHRQAAVRADDDQLLAATEAALDRYAAKLGVTPGYPTYWVDEFEMPRTCRSLSSSSYGKVFKPGTRWAADCGEWTYDQPPEFTEHPLFPGFGIALEIAAPAAEGQGVTVVGRNDARQQRTLSVVLQATSASDFLLLVDANLLTGRDLTMSGKVYSGGDLTWGQNNRTASDYYSEGNVVNTVTELDGARGYDTSGRTTYGNIRDVFDAELDFSRFWDDVGEIATLACGGAGICLNHQPTAGAYLIHPLVSDTQQYIDIWWSEDHSGPVGECKATRSANLSFTTESWWERQAHHPDVDWHWIGRFRPPANGLIWSDKHIVVGNRDPGLGRLYPAQIAARMTVLAGTVERPKNVIINSDIEYFDRSSVAVWGLIASDEVVVNPDAHDGDGHLVLHGSLLGQGTPGIRTADECGKQLGRVITNDNFTLVGSMASRRTPWMGEFWRERTLSYDTRLELVQPPNFPLLSDVWEIVDWSEDFTPEWAK